MSEKKIFIEVGMSTKGTHAKKKKTNRKSKKEEEIETGNHVEIR